VRRSAKKNEREKSENAEHERKKREFAILLSFAAPH
jgi:hypothetical protein